jgi:hypothetical protein
MTKSSATIRLGLAFGLTACLFSATGCANKLYPVRGTVTFEDGTPVSAGLVVFETQDGKHGVMARGRIQGDGSYQLSTERPGDGVPPGKYRVRLVPPEPDVDSQKVRSPSFDKSYTNFATSGLEFEVKAGATEYPIRLKRKT